MKLEKNSYDFFAFNYYTNKSCFSKEEFYDDLSRAHYSRKLVKKIHRGGQVNIRLLVNHITLFTNVFELDAAKELLLFNCSLEEKEIYKTVLNYLGFLNVDEMKDVRFNLETAKMLKEL